MPSLPASSPASPTSSRRVLDVEHDDGVATLWLDRPDARNALGRAFFEELPVVMAELSEKPAVRAVVVAARGRDFSVGLDLKEMGPVLADGPGGEAHTAVTASHAARAAATRRTLVEMQAAVSAVAGCPKPVIAAVHGYCIGGGMDLVTACDIRLASADAVFSVRETRMAMVADLGTLQRLPLVVGRGHVAELALTGRDVHAERAKEIGLVNDVFSDRDTLLDSARSMAHEIAALSPLAVQGTKAVLAANDGRTVVQGLEYVATWNAGMLASEDLAEAVRAFMEKRPPRFTGS
ncbi:MAG: crotonase/enoyl-CoA hydratase family protein [Acidimicrobiales bacterium]